MRQPLKLLQIGVGGYGAQWLKEFVPDAAPSADIRTVAVCDTNPDALALARRYLDLPEAACFSDAAAACAESGADIVLISTPPWDHSAHVVLAAEAGMDILCEKPVSASIEDAAAIAEVIEKTGRKIAFTMTHRFDRAHSTLRQEVHSGAHGALDYIAFRLTGELRRFASWGRFRHEMDDVMLVEAAIHHFDILRDLAGAPAAEVYARSWTPPWGQFAGDAQVLAIVEFENGVKASYESTACNAVSINEYFKGNIRAEFDRATVILDAGQVERLRYNPERGSVRSVGTGETVEPAEGRLFGNPWLVDRFADWVRGGPPMETRLTETFQSQALVFAALESAQSGKPVRVAPVLERMQGRAGG